jgi:hypothetical protein
MKQDGILSELTRLVVALRSRRNDGRGNRVSVMPIPALLHAVASLRWS